MNNKRILFALITVMLCMGIIACTQSSSDDEIKEVSEEMQETTVKENVRKVMILNCEEVNGAFTSAYGLELTSEEGEYIEGVGAYKSSGASSTRFRFALTEPVDITSCQDGALQFWLYIGDKAELLSTSIKVELGSAGEYDKSELQWSYNLTRLKANSWNKVTLEFADALQTSGETGPIDLSAVNFFRLYFSAKETNPDVLLILDDVCAIEREG